MSTRGALGFRLNDIDHITYNHYDSYAEGLGEDVLTFLRTRLATPGGERELRRQVAALRQVGAGGQSEVPTPEEVERYKEFADFGVGHPITVEWYSLLQKTQGNPDAILRAGVYEDASQFLNDSLFCEWAYIINLDTRMLEVYRGFQIEPHTNGRYVALTPKPQDWQPRYEGENYYYPVALIAEVPFDELPASIVTVPAIAALHQED